MTRKVRDSLPQVEPIQEIGSAVTICYAAKGHHDAAIFVGVLEREWRLTADAQHVRHVHWRNIPCEGEVMSVNSAPGRRAYPVTVVDREHIYDSCNPNKTAQL